MSCKHAWSDWKLYQDGWMRRCRVCDGVQFTRRKPREVGL